MTPTELIDIADIESALEALKPSFKYVKPLSRAADSLLEVISDTGDKYLLGLPSIDLLTRGFGPKELVLVVGGAHAAKTQLALTSILHNRSKRVLLLSLDDPAEMVLVKLLAMYTGVPNDAFELEIRNGSETAPEQLKEFARNTMSNLIVVDDSLNMSGVTQAVEEATEYWGAPPQMVILDYLQLLASDGDVEATSHVAAQADSIKRWIKNKPFPIMVLHQGSRHAAKPGKPIGIQSGSYGGEQQATFILGVSRRKDDEDLDEQDRRRHQDTVTITVPKNKRAGGRTGPYDGIDHFLVGATGLIRPFRDNDFDREKEA